MKTRKFASGGYQAEPNRNITEDVRARAMRFLQGDTGLSGKYHGDGKKPAKSVSPKPSSKRPATPTPLQQEIIAKDRALAAAREAREAETLRFQNDVGLDYPAGLETQYMGTQDRPLRRAKGGKVSSPSKRADGIAKRGKTKGRMF